jgi:predicted Rossmann fold flavoprotein
MHNRLQSGRRFDVVVIGAGAAGLMCAIEAGKRGRKVLVLEHNDRVGKKIGISGGGRCNFTNLGATWECYESANPAFCKSALARYTQWDFLALVEKHGIAYHEKTLGQQFCDGSSREIIAMLLAECASAGVEIEVNCRVASVTKPERFRVETAGGELEPEAVVIATGGLSFAKLGASDFGYRVARQFGLEVTPLRPGLVPLTLEGEALREASSLSGVSLPVIAEAGGRQFAESLLFTHRGLSGPAVLQVSSYWREGEPVRLDLLPGQEAARILAEGRRSNADLAAVLGREWPRRLAEVWVEARPELGSAGKLARSRPLAQWRREELEAVAKSLHGWTLWPSGTEGYAKAEVTLGGVDTRELSSKTMESKKVQGLYFIGEVVDVTGWLGGYNFQWAWASGFAAGTAV